MEVNQTNYVYGINNKRTINGFNSTKREDEMPSDVHRLEIDSLCRFPERNHKVKIY